MRVLFTGGRDFTDRAILFLCLDTFDAIIPITEVVVGDARGVDEFVREWARARGKTLYVEKARWKMLGKYAGIERNERMVKLWNPELVIAFPGGRGTKHCVEFSRKSGIEVIFPMQEIPKKERLLSEEFRIAGKDWVQKNAAAGLLEENKKVVFSELILKATEQSEKKIPFWQAEATVYSSQQWKDYIHAMMEAREVANMAKVKMKWIEIRFQEQNSAEAALRLEQRMSR